MKVRAVEYGIMWRNLLKVIKKSFKSYVFCAVYFFLKIFDFCVEI